MIPREEHIRQVNRFHDIVDGLDKKIEADPNDLDSLMKYFKITKVWSRVDDSIESIKFEVDNFKRDNK